jgi:hypothetical protein
MNQASPIVDTTGKHPEARSNRMHYGVRSIHKYLIKGDDQIYPQHTYARKLETAYLCVLPVLRFQPRLVITTTTKNTTHQIKKTDQRG